MPDRIDIVTIHGEAGGPVFATLELEQGKKPRVLLKPPAHKGQPASYEVVKNANLALSQWGYEPDEADWYEVGEDD